MKDLNLVKVTALSAFTETTKHGQFHGDPDSERNAHPKVPDYVVEKLAGEGRISVDPLDHDGDGHKGGRQRGAQSTRSRGRDADESAGGAPLPAVYEMTHVSFGRYRITGPGGFEETVKGKAAAEGALLELNSHVRASQDAGGDPAPEPEAGADEAPVD